MTEKILLTISYDGTNYAGWQRQKNALSVQQVIEEAMAKLCRRPVRILGGSRTDAGVHALGQKALVLEPCAVNIPIANIPAAINSHLPEDIRVTGAEAVPVDFHPLRNPAVKTYAYNIYAGRVCPPLFRLYTAHIRQSLDITAMKEAAARFTGVHDFAGFCGAGSEVRSTVREIYSAVLSEDGGMIRIEIKGNGFLYNMVRIIAGTLAEVGAGKILAGEISDIIKSKDRNRAGKTMPARGLVLERIDYVNFDKYLDTSSCAGM